MISYLAGAAHVARARPGRPILRLFALLLLLRALTPGVAAATSTLIEFDIAAGPAVETLKRAAREAHQEIMFPSELGQDVTTQPIKGSYTIVQALTRMLAGTDLTVVSDPNRDALTIRRTDHPAAPPAQPPGRNRDAAAVSAPPPPSAASSRDDIRMGEFTVLGKALSLRRAIADKRAENRISDGISADEVGSVPDYGLGEALQRIPGIAMLINNGRGEAQFLTIRGLNSDYDEVLVDGIALPSTETNRRQVSLDVLPASIADRADVYKSLTPDLDGNAIGGIVNLQTRSAFDHPGWFASGRADYGDYSSKRHYATPGPSGESEFTISDLFGPKQTFGLLIQSSYFRRDSSSLDTAADTTNFYTPAGVTVAPTAPAALGAIAVPNDRRWLSYDNVRQREGIFAKLEYDNHAGLRAHLTAANFHHTNQESRTSNILTESVTPTILTPTTSLVSKAVGQSDIDLYAQSRIIAYVDGGFDLRPTPEDLIHTQADFSLGHYRQDTTQEVYKTPATTSLAYSYLYVPGNVPYAAPLDGGAYVNNPANYLQTDQQWNTTNNSEHVLTLAADWSHNADVNATGPGFKGGGKFRNLSREYDFEETDYLPVNAALLPLSNVLDSIHFAPFNGRGEFMNVVDQSLATKVFQAQSGNFSLNPNDATLDLQSNYSATEKIYGAYAMGFDRWGKLFVQGGLRFEATDFSTTSFESQTVGKIQTWVPVTDTKTYSNLLPSAEAIYDLTDDLKLRGAFSHSLSRPNYSSLARTETYVDNGAGSISIASGNPDLKPRESDNFDASAEWYFARDGVVSVGLFRKVITNEIVTLTTSANQTVAGVGEVVTSTFPANSTKASVNGIEFGLTKTHFDFLPFPFNGLGAQANLTMLDMHAGQITMADGSQRATPELLESARRTANAALLYSIGRFSANVSMNFTSPMLLTISTSSPLLDIYYNDRRTVDFQTRFRLTRNWSVMFQGKNVTNDLIERVTGPAHNLVKEQLYNGRAFFTGFTFLFD